MSRSITSNLITLSGGLWDSATRAKFLDAAADGTLPEEAFRRWLEQDYLFASGLTTFQAIAAAKTPRPSQKTVIAGLVAMDAELDWFETNAGEKGYNLNTPAHPVCREYTDFLIAAAYTQSFEVLLAILFGVEVSYLAAWSALKPEGPYREYIQRWSNDGFREYVYQLCEATHQNPHPLQQAYFNEVLRLECDFWRMTWEG